MRSKVFDLVADSESPSSDNQAQFSAAFNMKLKNMESFSEYERTNSNRMMNKQYSIAVQRVRNGSITSSSQTLQVLRKLLQAKMNAKLDEVLQSFMKEYFVPAIRNIRSNNGPDKVTPYYISILCQQILDEAKEMYVVPQPTSYSDGDERDASKRPHHDEDAEEEASFNVFDFSSRSPPAKRQLLDFPETPTLLSGIKQSCRFTLSASVHSILESNTRGKFFSRHPEVFRYNTDAADRSWLIDQELAPSNPGKVHILIYDDVQTVISSEPYRSDSKIHPTELVSFSLPNFMLAKVQVAHNKHLRDMLRCEKSSGKQRSLV